MTNEIRSVIDNKIKACKDIYGFFPKDDHTNDQKLCVKVELVELLMQEGLEEFLNAIIEELPSIPDYDFLDASKSTEQKMLEGGERLGAHKYRQSVLNKLTNVREKLSTSITQ